MTRVLIVDRMKSSLVMTSEIFKDMIMGCLVDIRQSGAECVEYVKEFNPDMIVCDFDLPDTDGVMLSKSLRKIYNGPIVITAYPDDIVEAAIRKEQFVYNDSCAWVRKPVRFDELSEKITQFLIGNRRLVKRFVADFDAQVVGKGEGRGKRAPKLAGPVVDVGVGGLRVETDNTITMKKGDEVTVIFSLPRAVVGEETVVPAPLKLKGAIAWVAKANNLAGVAFTRMSETQRKVVEGYLVTAKEVDEDLAKVTA